MYLLLRSMRLLIPSAWFGAASFAFGGFYLSFVNLLPIMFCVSWMPWILLFMRRQIRRPNLFNFAAGALMSAPVIAIVAAIALRVNFMWWVPPNGERTSSER